MKSASLAMSDLNQEGYVMQTILADLLGLALLVVISVKLVTPMAKFQRRIRRTAKQVGGPKPHWLLGSMDKYAYTKEGLDNCIKRCKEYPQMVTMWMGPVWNNIQLYHPDVVRPVLTRSFPKTAGYEKTVKMLVGTGLVTSTGEVWKRHRRMLTSIFHFDIMKSHITIFNENCNDLLQWCEEAVESARPCDVTQPIATLSYANTMKCVFSRSHNEVVCSDGESYRNALAQLNDLSWNRLRNPLLLSDFVYSLSPLRRKFEKKIKTIHELLHKIIDERRSQLNSNKDGLERIVLEDATASKSQPASVFKRRKGKSIDFLDILLQSSDEEGGFTAQEVIDETLTFFVAGQETVASATIWTIYELANNKEWQDRCREEIHQIIGDKEIIESEDESRLVVMTRCIKEAMRLHPTAYVLGRRLTEDVTFTCKLKPQQAHAENLTLEAETLVNINVYALHRHPDVWAKPEVFDPDRFLPENSKERSPFAFIPFAAGPRNCIGQNFAMHAMRVTLTKLLRTYEVYRDDSTPEPIMQASITMQTRDGMNIKVRRVSHDS